MSNQAYNLKLAEAVNDLSELHQLENLPAEQNEKTLGMKYERKDPEWFAFYANLYIKYIECYKKLEDAYDQMLHPQKRFLVKKMLENTIIRLVEIKNELIFYNMEHVSSVRSDVVQLDELLLDLKLTDTALEVPIPRYFKADEKQRLDERDQIHEKLLTQFFGHALPEEEVIQDNYTYDFNLETAIRIIQKNERGRQGIERALKAKKKWKAEQKKQEKTRKLAEGLNLPDDYEREEAVLVIQKYYRGFIARETVENLRNEELLFLGMKRINEDPKNPESETYKYEVNKERRHAMQEEYMADYKKDLKKLKDELKAHDEPDLKEGMLEERRKRIVEYLELNEGKKLPTIVEIEKWNVVEPGLTPEEEEKKKFEEEEKKKEEKRLKDAAKKQSKDGKKPKKETPEEEFLRSRVVKGPTEAVTKLQENIKTYASDWESKPEDQKNFGQKHDKDVAKLIVKPLVEEEIRHVCNAMIEIELDNLRQKLGIKGKKKGMGGKKKKKKVKEEAPPQIEKLKDLASTDLLAELVEPDLAKKYFEDEPEKLKKEIPGGKIDKTKDRAPVDLLAELTQLGIAKKLMPAELTDLLGNFNKLGSQQSREQSALLIQRSLSPENAKAMKGQILTEPDPSFGHIRQNVAELLAMPLGSSTIREKVPSVYKTALFLGPQGSGKSLVVRALHNQCSALLLDLSPSNLRLSERFNDSSSKKKLFYMVWKVAREFQPCIILVDECDLVFPGKKKSPEAKLGMKIKRNLMDLKKFLKPKDRVLIIGCMNKTDINRKELKKYFEKTIYFPYPDYETRKMVFKHFVEKKGGVLKDNFPLSTFAHVTEGYTAGSFKQAVDKVLTQRRIEQLPSRPLTIGEFVGALSGTFFCYRQEYAKFKELTNYLTGVEERQKKLLQPPEETDPKKKKKGGKK